MKKSTKTKERLLPRQITFLEKYLDTKSPTFSNAYQSALEAGYSNSTALALLPHMPTWLKEQLDKRQMLQKAERNLNSFLDDDVHPKIKADITKFVAERLGKETWSTKENLEIKGDIRMLELEAKLKDILK